MARLTKRTSPRWKVGAIAACRASVDARERSAIGCLGRNASLSSRTGAAASAQFAVLNTTTREKPMRHTSAVVHERAKRNSHGSSSPEPELPTQSGAADGGTSLVKAELSRQEYWSIYRQHTSDEVRAVAEATAQASEDADADVSDEQLSMEQKLTRLYRSIDSDFSNSVDAKELWEGLARIGLGLSHDHVQKLVRSADGDGDGTLDLAEFLAAFTASFLVK